MNETSFDYQNIDTSRIAHESDERILEVIKQLDIIGRVSAYAYIAEVCKRLERKP